MPFLVPVLVAIGQFVLANLPQILASLLSAALNALLTPKAPNLDSARAQLQNTVRDPVRVRELVFGRIKKGGSYVFSESVHNDVDLLMWIAVADHEVTAIDEIYFYDQLVVDQNGVVQKKFKKHVEFEKFLGASPQTASAMLQAATPKWTAAHRCDGVAGVALKIKFNMNLFNSIPNVSVVMRGAKVYDPRSATTVYSTNPALVLAHYLNHPTFGLNAAYGTVIDTTMLIAAANACDEDVAIKAGHVLEFDGEDDVIDMGKVLGQTGAITIEARVYPGAVNRAAMKILDRCSAVDGFSLQIENDKVRFRTRDLSNVDLDTSAGAVAASTWHRIAARWDPAAGTKTIRINGVQVAQATSVTGTLVVAANTKLIIGDKFKGRLQDVRLWSVARTNTEIDAYADKTLGGEETNLAGYWRLDEKKGERAEDGTETANDGIIDGAAWVEDNSVLGTEKRYSCNGVVFSDQLPRQAISGLLTAMAGTALLSGGKWLIRAGVWDAPTIAFNEQHARDTMVIQPKRPHRELFNAVRGTYVSPVNDWEIADFPPVTNATYETEDGGERIYQDISLPYTISPSTAQRLAWLTLLRSRKQLSVSYKANLAGLKVRAGDVIELTHQRMGWNAVDMEVGNWTLVCEEDEEGVPYLGVDMDLREIDAAVFDFNPATDETPQRPSPTTTLPNPFGAIAITSGFIDKSGYAEIERYDASGTWGGTLVGLVHNPLTGHLNPMDRADLNVNNFDVFDYYCKDPWPSASYETPELDIDFDDEVRTFTEYTLVKGGGVDGSFNFQVRFDYQLDGGVYDGYETMFRAAAATGRKFKYRLDLDFSSGAAGYVGAFSAVIDKTTLFQDFVDLVVPVGGLPTVFPKPYHKKPSLSWGVTNSGARTVSFTAISTTGFTPKVFDAGTESGGTISVQSQGV